MNIRRHSSRLCRAALVFAVLAALCACTPQTEAPPTTPTNVVLTNAQRQHIRIYTVENLTFNQSIDATGIVDFDNDQATSILAPFSGPVSRLLVSPGDKVEKGQALATVDSPDFATAMTGYTKAQATAQTSRRLADADTDLLDHNGISAREAQQAQTDALNAEADRDAALQSLLALGADRQTITQLQQGKILSHMIGVIRSPISGTVAEKLITPGQLLQAGATPAFTVADLSKMWVMAQISDANLALVHPGDSVDIEAGSTGSHFFGTVDNISAEVDPDTRSVLARVVVANPGNLLKNKMYVRVQIHSRTSRSGLLVPVSAILRDDENLPFVYVQRSDQSLARQHVVLGERAGDQYHIADGLRLGDRIVVDGGLFLQFMQSQ